MIYEHSYSFKELILNLDYLNALLGFPDGVLPEPFDEFIAEAIQLADKLCTVRGAFYISENVAFSPDNSLLIVDETEFHVGKTVAKEFRNSDCCILFICSAGQGISQHSQKLMTGENAVLGFILDTLGTLVVEEAANQLQLEIKRKVAEKGMKITNRYSPGYCNWSVADQHRLFSFFPENCCGIYLTDSALMNPVKSVSGIIGAGSNVKFREHTCELCNLTDCFYRNSSQKISI
jgi:hypothetical protein